MVSSSESAPRRGPQGGPRQTRRNAVTGNAWAPRLDAKSGTTQVEALRIAQWPAGNRRVEQFIRSDFLIHREYQ